MSDWKIVVPEATINKVLNPSAETTANFAAGGAATVTRSTTYQKYGLYSFRVQTTGTNEGIELTLGTLANAIHYATVRVRGTLPASWDWSLDDATYTSPALLEQIDSNWALYGLQFPAAQANASTTLFIDQNGSGSGDFYLDGVQVEEKEYWTTYCDGTQSGCSWLGTAHAATSERSAQSRAGGRVQDLEDDYNLNVGGMSGTGAAPIQTNIDEYAILPGGEINSTKVDPVVMTLSGVITGSTQAEFHSKRDALVRVLDPLAFPGQQPTLLRYEGATVHKEIAVHYDGGLDASIQASDPCYWEKVNIRFLAPSVYWFEIGESAADLDTNDSATIEIVAGKLRSNQQWNALGPPNAAGTYTGVNAIARDIDGSIYFGGNFLNFDNIANADYIVKYDPFTGTYSALSTGLNGLVQALAFGPDGILYLGGQFTNAGGDANADYLAQWNGTSFSAVGTGPGAATIVQVHALAFGLDGTLYIGGDFRNWGGDANADAIVAWSGSAYSALSTGIAGNDIVFGIAVTKTTVYVGGNFTLGAGAIGDRLAQYDIATTTWSAMGTGANAIVLDMAVDGNGKVYAGGQFTTLDGQSAIRIGVWNGTAWSKLGDGANNDVNFVTVAPDNSVWIVGAFGTVGGINIANNIARWNQYAWVHTGITFSVGTGTAILVDNPDPVIETLYDVYVGLQSSSGSITYEGITSVDNEGSVQAFPKIVYARSGGTTAVIETLRNETTGKELLFNYSLLDGETLIIDLDPLIKSIESSFFGSRQDAVLANSDSGTWALQRGVNDITSYINESGTPTLVSYMQWRDAFSGYD